MENYNEDEIIKRLEQRTVRFKFPSLAPILFMKGRRDSKALKVHNEINKYFATYQRFVEEEFKNLVKEIHPSIIVIETAEEKIRRAKEQLDQKLEPKKYDDSRKQKRESARANAQHASWKAKYEAAIAEYDEEKAFLDTSLNIVVRLCLSAYQYTVSSLNNYLKYVEGEYKAEIEDLSYEQLYKTFADSIKGDDVNEKED